MTLAYSLRDVSFAYDTEPILRVGRLDVAAGEIVGLVGPNGSGKTTLLHLLAFIESPLSGRMSFFGEVLQGTALLSARRKVSLLLQNPYLFHESVLANVTWGLRLRKVPAEKAREIALNALDRVGLSGFGHRYSRSLSGGETQRVALARALALEPSVLLLDEPFNHMDREAVRQTEEIVTGMCRERGTTVIFTTHAIDKVQAVAHRLIHVWQGRIVPTGPEKLFKGVLKHQGSVFDTGRIAVSLETPATEGEFIAIDPSSIMIDLNGIADDSRNRFAGIVIGLSEEQGGVKVVVDAGERITALLKADDPVVPALRLGLHVAICLDVRGWSVL